MLYSKLTVLKCFYQMGASYWDLVKEWFRLTFDSDYRNEWCDQEWIQREKESVMRKCLVCGYECVDVRKTFEDADYDMFERCDCLGPEALTEREQMVVMGYICSPACYEEFVG